MYNEEIERLIDAALLDGKITDRERAVLKNKAVQYGIDSDEFDLELDARLLELDARLLEEDTKHLEQEHEKAPRSGLDIYEIKKQVSIYKQTFENIVVKEEVTRSVKTSKFWYKNVKGKMFFKDSWEPRKVMEVSDEKTLQAKKDYIKFLAPQSRDEILAALEFLLSLLPSQEEVTKGRSSTIMDAANKRFRSIFDDAKTKNISDAFFSRKLAEFQNDYNELCDRITRDQDEINKEIVVADKKIKIRKIRNWIFLALIPIEWIWLNVLEGWDWWWCLALSIPILGAIVCWMLFVQEDFMGELKEKLAELKNRQRDLKTASEVYKRIE